MMNHIAPPHRSTGIRRGGQYKLPAHQAHQIAVLSSAKTRRVQSFGRVLAIHHDEFGSAIVCLIELVWPMRALCENRNVNDGIHVAVMMCDAG